MNAIIQFLLPSLLLYKYWAIFCITFIAALILPIPPGTLLMASSAFASQGYLSFPLVVIVGVLGNIAGDNLGYWLAWHYGKKVLHKIGFGRIIDSHNYKMIEKKIRRNSGALIFFSRFEVLSNLSVNIISGLGRVPYQTYLLYESLGELFQVTLYCSIGYAVGDNWEVISVLISKFLLLILLVAVLLVAIFWKRIWRAMTRERE